MTDVESPPGMAVCPVGGTVTGFSGTATSARMTVETICSCGERHAVPPGSAPPAVGRFASVGRLARTWADPATGALGRGALSQTRLYYTVADGPEGRAVRFSTDVAHLAGHRPEIWPAAVAATLAGQPPPMPLTPYEGVFQLACGTTLTIAGERERLTMDELDLAELAAGARRIVGRPSDPAGAIARALRHAVADALDLGDDGAIGYGGGLGAVALAALSPDVPRLHVHMDVPVLARRRSRLTPDVTVIDGTPLWERAFDGPGFGLPGEGDAWPPTAALLTSAGHGAGPLLSGAGLARMLTGSVTGSGLLRNGWLQLTTAAPFPTLFGSPGWRAWWPPRSDDPPPDPGHSPDDTDHAHGHGHGWLTEAAGQDGVVVTSAKAASHLVPVDDDPKAATPGGEAVQLVIDRLEHVQPLGTPRLDPVLICAHPVVLGTVVLLARHGRLRVRWRDGYMVTAPPLRALVPGDWRPTDVAPEERDKLLATAFVARRLATPAQRAALLAQVEGSPWVVTDRLRHVLADPARVLADAQALRRLYVTAAHHPRALNAEVRA
jgi:hypothetical protein